MLSLKMCGFIKYTRIPNVKCLSIMFQTLWPMSIDLYIWNLTLTHKHTNNRHCKTICPLDQNRGVGAWKVNARFIRSILIAIKVTLSCDQFCAYQCLIWIKTAQHPFKDCAKYQGDGLNKGRQKYLAQNCLESKRVNTLLMVPYLSLIYKTHFPTSAQQWWLSVNGSFKKHSEKQQMPNASPTVMIGSFFFK